MPKMKSRRGVMKRFKVTGSGRIRRSHAFTSHLMTAKTRKQKRRLRKSNLVHPSDERRVERLMAGA